MILYPHQTAKAQHQVESRWTVNTPLLACRRPFQRRPISVALNFHAARRSPQTAGDFNISNYTLLNTFKLHARRIWLFTAGPDALNPLSVVNWTLTKIRANTCTRFPTANTLITSQTWSLKHRHHLCCARRTTPGQVLSGANTLLSHGNATLRVSLRQTYITIPTICFRCVKSTIISSVGSRRRAWRRTMRMCWKKKTPLCVSQASKTGMAARSWWLACQMIWLLWSGNYTLGGYEMEWKSPTPYQILESRHHQKH